MIDEDVDNECGVDLTCELLYIDFVDGFDAECGVDGYEEIYFLWLDLLEDSVGEAEIVWGHFEMGEGFLISFAVDGLLGVYFVFKSLYFI